jgi:hypothetical protein
MIDLVLFALVTGAVTLALGVDVAAVVAWARSRLG